MKILVTLLLTEEKCKATFDSWLRLSIEEACREIEKHWREGNFDGENCFSEADIPLQSQINLAYRH